MKQAFLIVQAAVACAAIPSLIWCMVTERAGLGWVASVIAMLVAAWLLAGGPNTDDER